MVDVKKKLVELLRHDNCPLFMVFGDKVDVLADYLIAHGVTVQECKVGDVIYETDSEHGVIKHEVYEVVVVFQTTATDDNGNKWGDYWTSEDIGNSFKTRDEAEANLHQPAEGE